MQRGYGDSVVSSVQCFHYFSAAAMSAWVQGLFAMGPSERGELSDGEKSPSFSSAKSDRSSSASSALNDTFFGVAVIGTAASILGGDAGAAG